ncbi:MAG: STAS domain-containing protein [Lachnospiraceae bacterium]|nr:STAS domain-containing protein [Lachnospiraceae bacterium]
MLNINKTIENSAMTIALEGRLDTITSMELEQSIKESLEDIQELTLDLEKLDYISSAGLRVLLSTQKVMNEKGSMKVIHVNDVVMEIFEVTGFTDILTIEP